MNTNTTPSGADALKTERESFAAWIRTHEDEHGAVDEASAWAGWTGRVALSAAQDAPVCLSKTAYSEKQSALPLADAPQCRLAAQAVPEIDYEALIVAARAKNRNWTPGTNGCVAFKHGAEWFRSVVLASAPAAPQPSDDDMPESSDERHLRRLLAVRVAMPNTYFDDGEAHGAEHGIQIDFMREPVAHIDAKLRALNVARLAVAAPQPAQPLIADEICDAWEFITGHQIAFGPSSEGRTMYLSADEVLEFARAIEQAATEPLLARIAELEAELEKTKAIFAASCNHAAVMEMDRDARRYRWLRARWGRIADEYDGDSNQLVAIRESDSHFEGWDVEPASLDRAIDAAIEGHEAERVPA